MAQAGRIILGTLVAVSLSSPFASAQLLSPIPPQPRILARTWFEGFYTRITSDNGQHSIGVITGAFYSRRTNDNSTPSSGYIAIMKRNVTSGKLEVYECFPQSPRVTVPRRRLISDDDNISQYRWEAEGIGFLTQNEMSLQLPNGTSLKATFCCPKPWDAEHSHQGPEGLAVHLRIIRSHWHVYSLASRGQFELKTPTSHLAGKGFAHLETNWGEAFPSAYVWAQGSSGDGNINFVLAGGLAPIAHGSCEAWLLGLRTPRSEWNFRPQVPGTVFTTCIDSHQGRFSMKAKSVLRTVTLDLCAAPDSFSTLAIPTAAGFEPGTVMSYSATARIRTFQHGPTGRNRRLVDEIELSNVALEFGGAYYPLNDRMR